MQGRTFYILEVDTSDGVCSLSTLLLRLKSPLDWPKQLTLLAEELTQKSLHWPSQRLKMLFRCYPSKNPHPCQSAFQRAYGSFPTPDQFCEIFEVYVQDTSGLKGRLEIEEELQKTHLNGHPLLVTILCMGYRFILKRS